MPSSPGYKRDYHQEYLTARKRGEDGTGHNSGSAERDRLRRLALKRGMVKKGEDLAHVKALSAKGPNTLANARAETPHDNRSYARNSDGSLKDPIDHHKGVPTKKRKK